MALWFIMSQQTEPKFLIIGGVSSLLIAAFCTGTLIMKGMKTDREYGFFSVNPFRMLVYLFWLIVQIIKSAVYVSGIALWGRSKVDPSVVWFKADYDSPYARALLANSITLTPGTITIEITDEGYYSVHALTEKLRDGLLDGSMQAKVAWVYHEDIDFEVLEEDQIPKQERLFRKVIPQTYIARRKDR